MTPNEKLKAVYLSAKAAVGPDREIDFAIAEALGLTPDGYERAVEHGRPMAYYWCIERWKEPFWAPLEYTASLDAAMTLVPPGAWLNLYRFTDGRGAADVRGMGRVKCHTLAIAITAASLRAMMRIA